ncbi:MAG: hypothetical protein IJR54_09130 [Oscillibacter sp.]|nr:hypothetical protein [Oscillibacter sp.]
MNNEEKPGEATEQKAALAQKSNMSVFLYILLLFSAALLLMGLSSLIHQRNNTEALGKLQSSVSVMQEVQNLQDKIIVLQESRQTLEEQLKQARNDQQEALERTEREHRQAEAMRQLYVIQAQYQAGRYQACQASVEAFESAGLSDSLPSESADSNVISPLDCYRQLQEAVPARIAEASRTPPDENS